MTNEIPSETIVRVLVRQELEESTEPLATLYEIVRALTRPLQTFGRVLSEVNRRKICGQ